MQDEVPVGSGSATAVTVAYFLHEHVYPCQRGTGAELGLISRCSVPVFFVQCRHHEVREDGPL